MRLAFLIILFLLVAGCAGKTNETTPSGHWKVDSIYTYYNGFSFMRKDVTAEPTVEYLPEGKLKLTKGNESRFFSFEVRKPDTLYYRLDNNVSQKFVISQLSNDQLVLRQDMQPLFTTASQIRYEVRYLSKVTDQ